MTIIFERCTGFANSHYVIRYVSPWTAVFGPNQPMKFLKGEVTNIVDVTLAENGTLRIGTYPHNRGIDVESRVREFESEIRQIIREVMDSGIYENMFTIRLGEKGPELITENMFENFYPTTVVSGEMFIFKGENHDEGFPCIFFVDGINRTSLSELFLDVFAKSSHHVIQQFNRQTQEGKEFTYMFLASIIAGKFLGKSSKRIPDLTNITMPSSGLVSIPPNLNTEAFVELIESPKVKRLAVIDGVEVIEESPDKTSEENVENSSYSGSLISFEDTIVQAVLQGTPINLTDVLNYGVSETNRLVGTVERALEIQPDIMGIAKRMCFFHGQMHIIPLDANFDPEEFFAEPIDLFVLDSEATYPR